MDIQILKYAYDERAALETLLQTDSTLDITDISTVYYPYLRYRFLITVGRRNKMIKTKKLQDCIVDRVYGTIYIADGKSDYMTVEAEEDEILDVVQEMDYCDRHAHDFTLSQFIEKAKLLLTPKLTIMEREEFYKKYYVVEVVNLDGLEYYVLVDAIDCSLAVLDHEKYLDQYDEFAVDFNRREYLENLEETVAQQKSEVNEDEYDDEDEEEKNQ